MRRTTSTREGAPVVEYDIRALKVDDLEPLHALEKRSQPLPWSDDQLLLELVNENGRVLGVYVDNKLVGHVCTRRQVDELWVLNLAVDPEHRRCGLARALLESAMQYGRADLMTSLWLEVRESNVPARSLYKAMGLEEQATRGTYYPPVPPATEREGAVVMSKPL